MILSMAGAAVFIEDDGFCSGGFNRGLRGGLDEAHDDWSGDPIANLNGGC